ncbi:hypothetical protein V7266_30105 [Neobacillus drentensis]|uniref:hypothetical protein n=1 Tax=Neobacillus drentensis TaxID=220684 RepID=UPI0030004C22
MADRMSGVITINHSTIHQGLDKTTFLRNFLHDYMTFSEHEGGRLHNIQELMDEDLINQFQ